MKKIYIVLTHSGSLLSKTIKIVKVYEYTHGSISLDKDLKQLYSFDRIKPYNAFIGGFVQESPNYGTFKRFSKTKSKIFCIDVTEKQYKKSVREFIDPESLNIIVGSCPFKKSKEADMVKLNVLKILNEKFKTKITVRTT